MTTPSHEPVAITGMAVLLPGARDLAAYWDNLVSGTDALTDAPAWRWDPGCYPDPVYCRRGGFVDGLAEFEPTRFGLMPHAVASTDPDQLIALAVAADALADAGGAGRLGDRDRIGVVLGRGGYLSPGLARHDQRVRTAHQLTRTLGELLPELGEERLRRVREAFCEALGPQPPEAAIGLVPNLAASRLASRLDLRGPAYTVDAACASSLVAVEHAVARLAAGECDAMLAGGVHHCHDITLWTVFSQLGVLSPSGLSRPFSAESDGILIGEGTGVLVLRRLADAERDGDRVYAVIRGTGVAGDGRAGALVSPDPGGQARAVRQAWRAAGLDPRAPGALGLLEAHGTGAPAGDAAELAMLAEVFGPPDERERGREPVIGSVKSMIGHAMPAAGAAGLVKAALALHRATLLPTLGAEPPHPALARTRFRPVASARPWRADGPRRAAVSAFGFGGINAHVVLEEAPGGTVPRSPAPPSPALVREPARVLLFAAESPAALAERLDADDAALRAGPAHGGGDGGGCRLALVDPTAKRLALARRAAARGRAWRGRSDVWFSPAPLLAGGGRLAFVFPGLEAEFAPRGLAEIARRFGLPPVAGEPGATGVGDVARHGLRVLAVGRLLDQALRRMGLAPDGVAGHSVGEWAAMRASGLWGPEADEVLASFDPDALRVPGLVFAAIGAPAERVTEALADWPDVVLSHDNSPRQSMVCGPGEAVGEVVAWFRERRVLARVLPFRSGFHTPMLAPYLEPLLAGARRLPVRAPRVPVWSGTTAAPFPEQAEEVRELFRRHLLEPVRFRPLIEAMYAAGFRAFVQLGPGQLGSLIGDVLGERGHLAVAANSPHRDGLAQLHRVAAALWAEGAAVDPGRLCPAAGPGRRAVRLDLGGALVSLGAGARRRLAGEVRQALADAAPPAAGPVPAAGAGGGGELAELSRLAGTVPVAAELRQTLADTAQAAARLLTARQARSAGAVAPGRLRVSVADMPYLRDHCFFPQRAGWPELSDRRPVVPATTVLHHLMEFAESRSRGLRAVAVHDLRLTAWTDAVPAREYELTARPAGPGRLRTAFGANASAEIELAPGYPAPPPPPQRPGPERPCGHRPAELYRDRWLFHGPAFQGLTELTALGERHVRGVLTVPPAPGGLLDNVGQLLGYWTFVTLPERSVIFPVAVRALRFFGPHPAPGTALACLVRVVAVTEREIEADAWLTHGDTVWAQIRGWRDRRFGVPPARRSSGYPERRGLSVARPEGWSLLFDQWPDLASRDLVMRMYLGRQEREEYARRPPRGRRQWLLGRIAAKDAVRRWLWERGEGEVFPAEITVRNDPSGRPVAAGAHGRRLPPLALSLAHRGEAAVALVGAGSGPAPGVGIDIEEVAGRGEASAAFALGEGERALLAERCANSGESPQLWFTRFWAAKEAVAKAEGTGLRGRPKDFAVTAAGPAELAVAVRGRRYRVRSACVTEGGRQYVVAWTTSPSEDEETNE